MSPDPSATASQGNAVARIIQGTGSTLPPEDLGYYRKLVASRSHVQATLLMMAQWKLDPLLARLPDNDTRTLLIAADGDKAVPPQRSKKACDRMPNAHFLILPSLGHLAQEEDAATIAAAVLDELSDLHPQESTTL